MKKYKKPLLIALVVLDVAIIVFFLVLSIMILTAVTKYKAQAANNTEGLVKAILQMKPVASFFAFVLPMFLVLVGNIVGLMLYVRKTTKKEPAKIEDLTEEQKEELRQAPAARTRQVQIWGPCATFPFCTLCRAKNRTR